MSCVLIVAIPVSFVQYSTALHSRMMSSVYPVERPLYSNMQTAANRHCCDCGKRIYHRVVGAGNWQRIELSAWKQTSSETHVLLTINYSFSQPSCSDESIMPNPYKRTPSVLRCVLRLDNVRTFEERVSQACRQRLDFETHKSFTYYCT